MPEGQPCPIWRGEVPASPSFLDLLHIIYVLNNERQQPNFAWWSNYSLTAAPDQRGPYSDRHNERSCADDHSESIVHPWSSSTCCIQVFLGRPGGRFQSGSGQGICPARGWHSAGGCCGLAHLVVGGNVQDCKWRYSKWATFTYA